MSNYRFGLLITPEYIYDKLPLEQKEQFNHVEIVSATVFDEGLEIECLALEDETVKLPFRQVLLGGDDGYITAKEIQTSGFSQ